MSSGPQSEKNLDTSNISAELLLLTLKACRAGLFYSPMLEAKGENVAHFSHGHDPGSAWSLNVSQLFGLEESIKDASELIKYILEEDQANLIDCVTTAITEKRRESDCEYRIRRPDGEIRWLHSRILVGLTEEGELRYLASMLFDINEQKQEQEALAQKNLKLEQAQRCLREALDVSQIAIFRHAVKNRHDAGASGYDDWNYNLDRLYGYPQGTEMTKERQVARIGETEYEALRLKTLEAIKTQKLEYQHEYPVTLADNSTRWMVSKCKLELDEAGKPSFISGATIDISDRKLAEEQTRFIATHDVLTELPNRLMFSNLLTHTIETAKRYCGRFALFFIDLDRFKSINDALGHQAGDQLLVDFAHRLRARLRSSDVLARMSGDEFVLLAPEVADEYAAAHLARKILEEASRPVELLGQRCQVTASVGICLYPENGEDEATLLKHADAAMYIAKEVGKNNYQFYNAESTSQSLERLALENELRTALQNNELSLNYQAKLALQNDLITGVEALLRWNNSKFGSVSPAVFIPIAEETGLIVEIGRWVLMTACKQNVEWQRQGLPALCVSVNLSARQFLNENLLKYIEEALTESGMQPQLLELEITESMVMHRVEDALAKLHEIKRLGVKIAIDDFGTGYSSLAQLKRFPIDTLKVDQSFIREVVHDREDQAITNAIIAMGKSMSLTIIAEGVETREQHDFLRSHSCDEMQGFYFSRPVSSQEFSKLLGQHLKLQS